MAIIDYNHIWNGKFAALKPCSRILLHIITGVCNPQTGEFYHSVETLAHLAGLSERAVRNALRELESRDPPIISSEPRPGKTDLKTHLPTARFSQNALFSQVRGATDAPLNLRGATDAARGANNDTRGGQQMPPKNNNPKNNSLKTTAAHRISPALIAEMTERTNVKRVLDVVVAMQSMNGEVKNANAYFRAAVIRGYVPTSAKARKKLEEQERKKTAEKRREEERRKRELKEEQFRRESDDPEAQRRIKAEMDKIFDILNESES